LSRRRGSESRTLPGRPCARIAAVGCRARLNERSGTGSRGRSCSIARAVRQPATARRSGAFLEGPPAPRARAGSPGPRRAGRSGGRGPASGARWSDSPSSRAGRLRQKGARVHADQVCRVRAGHVDLGEPTTDARGRRRASPAYLRSGHYVNMDGDEQPRSGAGRRGGHVLQTPPAASTTRGRLCRGIPTAERLIVLEREAFPSAPMARGGGRAGAAAARPSSSSVHSAEYVRMVREVASRKAALSTPDNRRRAESWASSFTPREALREMARCAARRRGAGVLSQYWR